MLPRPPSFRRPMLALSGIALLLGFLAVVPAGAAGSDWHCWPPDGEISCGETIASIAILGTGDGWAVGAEGTILRLSGRKWVPAASPTEQDLRSISMLSPSDGWVVGGEYPPEVWFGWLDENPCGPIWPPRVDSAKPATYDAPRDADPPVDDEPIALHWDGVAWTAHALPTDEALVSVDMIAADDVWAVGRRGAIIHWDGAAWALVESPVTDGSLKSIDMVSRDDGWAIGGNGYSIDGAVMLRWDGRRWSKFPFTFDVDAIHMVAANDGWAVGSYRDKCQSAILRWNGSRWTVFKRVDGRDLRSIRMLSAQDGWVGGVAPLRWNGTTWSKVGLAEGWSLGTVAGVPGGEAWAAGDGGYIYHWDGRTWSARVDVRAGARGLLQAVDALSPEDAWAVGTQGAIVHWDGSTWTQVASPVTAELTAVEVVATDDVWAAGAKTTSPQSEATIIHWNGRAWSEVHSSNRSLIALTMATATDGWAVGNALLRWNGADWSLVEDLSIFPLSDVDAVAADDVWAVGSYGTIRHWDGSHWSTVEVNLETRTHLTAVDMLSATDGWAIRCEEVPSTESTPSGRDSVMLRWDGERWAPRHRAVNVCLQDLAMASDRDGWAVGFGQMLHWDGATWTPYPEQPTWNLKFLLNAVDVLPDGRGWAVGYPILRLDEPWPSAPTETPTATAEPTATHTPAPTDIPTAAPTPTNGRIPISVYLPWTETSGQP